MVREAAQEMLASFNTLYLALVKAWLSYRMYHVDDQGRNYMLQKLLSHKQFGQ